MKKTKITKHDETKAKRNPATYLKELKTLRDTYPVDHTEYKKISIQINERK